MDKISLKAGRHYRFPAIRVVELILENAITQSNTETIEDDGHETGWD